VKKINGKKFLFGNFTDLFIRISPLSKISLITFMGFIAGNLYVKKSFWGTGVLYWFKNLQKNKPEIGRKKDNVKGCSRQL